MLYYDTAVISLGVADRNSNELDRVVFRNIFNRSA